MTKQLLKCVTLIAVLAVFVGSADAQRRGRTRTQTNQPASRDTVPQQNVQQNTDPANIQRYNP